MGFAEGENLGAAPRLAPLASLARLARAFHVPSEGVEFGD